MLLKIIIREQLSNIPLNTHKLNSRSINCFIYLLIHRCWSNRGSRCSLWQRYPLPETGSPKWWWVCPYRWQKQPKVWRKYAGCCPNETPGVKRHGVAVISLTSPPLQQDSAVGVRRCIFCSNVAPSRHANGSLQLQKGSDGRHRFVTFQTPVASNEVRQWVTRCQGHERTYVVS